MQKTTRTLVIAGLAWALIATATAPRNATAQEAGAPGVEVTTAVIATDVQDREPVGEGTSFDADVGNLYFYTAFEGDFPEQQLEHVWLHEGEEVARVRLTVRAPRWRTWSVKTMPAEPAGDWTVRIVDADGAELEAVEFTISDA